MRLGGITPGVTDGKIAANCSWDGQVSGVFKGNPFSCNPSKLSFSKDHLPLGCHGEIFLR